MSQARVATVSMQRSMYMPSLLVRLVLAAWVLGMLAVSNAWAWQGPTNLTGDFNPTNSDWGPDLHEDSAGNWHLTWMGKYDGDYRVFHRMRNPAGVWGSVYIVRNGNSSEPFRPNSFLDANDNLHVVWSVSHSGGGLAGAEVYYRKRSSNGSWGSTVNLSNSGGIPSLDPNVVADSAGRIYVAWHASWSNWEIAFRHFNGSSWQPPLTSPPEFVTNTGSPIENRVSMDIDDAGTAHLSWNTYNEVYYRTRNSSGVWSSVANISNNSGSSRDQRLDVLGDGTAHLVWHDTSEDSEWEYFYATKPAGGSWTTPINISNNDETIDSYGAVAAGADGSVHVIWQDYDKIWYARKGTYGWSLPIVLVDSDIGAGNCLLVDSNSDVTAVVEMNGDLQSFFKVYPDVVAPDSVIWASIDAGNQQVDLNWSLPFDIDVQGSILRYKATGYPTGPTDGTLLADHPGLEGTWQNYIHANRPNGQKHYYVVYSYDDSRNYASPVYLEGTPAGPADMDRDADVDQKDWGLFQNCLTGDGIPQNDAACEDAKLDTDTDVDTADTAIFLGCVSGPDNPADPNCAN